MFLIFVFVVLFFGWYGLWIIHAEHYINEFKVMKHTLKNGTEINIPTGRRYWRLFGIWWMPMPFTSDKLIRSYFRRPGDNLVIYLHQIEDQGSDLDYLDYHHLTVKQCEEIIEDFKKHGATNI